MKKVCDFFQEEKGKMKRQHKKYNLISITTQRIAQLSPQKNSTQPALSSGILLHSALPSLSRFYLR
jgi:hypothetical protein